MADQSILREYLVSLGFKVDTMAQSKFSGELASLDKRAINLGRGLVGVATAAQAMVAIFANQMEKLYYASKLAETSAGNLRAVEFGAKQIGLTGDLMRQSLVNMASAIRMNPGLIGLLNSLGVRVEGRDKSDVLVDLVTELKKMPFAIGARYAEYFGISPNDLLLLQDGLDVWKEKIELQKRLAREMGIDQEAAAAAGKEYSNTWGEILMRVGLFKDAVSIQMLPAMREFADVTIQVLNDWTKIVKEWKGGADFWQRIKEGLGLSSKREGVTLSPESKARLGIKPPEPYVDPTGGFKKPIDDAYERFMRFGKAKKYISSGSGAGRGQVNPPLVRGTETSERPEDLFARLEQQYGLPSGLLDRIWWKESNRGRNMLSSAGARGHFQFMPKTAAEYGIAGQEDDLTASASAAAKKMAGLLKYYKGDLKKAAAAYNLGEGNLDSYLNGRGKYALGLPRETEDYALKVAGGVPVQVNQTNNITVSGVSDPKVAAAEIAREQREVNADLVRNLTPRMQ